MIISEKKLQKILSSASNKKKVFASGVFDILHIGHLEYLKKAKSLGDILVVWVDTDQRVRKRKGCKRPITPLLQRMQILASIKYVDYVLPFQEESPARIIQKFKPNLIVRSGKDKKNKSIHKLVQRYKGKIHYIKPTTNISTTKIINKIQKND